MIKIEELEKLGFQDVAPWTGEGNIYRIQIPGPVKEPYPIWLEVNYTLSKLTLSHDGKHGISLKWNTDLALLLLEFGVTPK